MNVYSVTFIQNGENYESVVRANSADEARTFIAEKYGIDYNFSIPGNQDENNHVGAVIQIN